LAIFRRRVILRRLLDQRFKLLIGRGGCKADVIVEQRDIFRRAPLPEIAVNGAAEGRRRGADAKRERAEQLLAGNIGPRASDILRLAVPVLGKKLLEHKAIELAELVAEGGLVSNNAANGLIIRI